MTATAPTPTTREDNIQYRIVSAMHSITTMMRRRFGEEVTTELCGEDKNTVRFFKGNHYQAWHMVEIEHVINICKTLGLLCYISTYHFVNKQWQKEPRMGLEVFAPTIPLDY